MLDSLGVEILPSLVVTLCQSCLGGMLVEQLNLEETVRDDLSQEVNRDMVSLQDTRIAEHFL